MRSRLLVLAFPFLAACGAETPGPESDGSDRGGLAKADVFGSCENPSGDFCGGKSTGTCWCDDLCVDYGDCCSDAGNVCGIDLPEPEPEDDACGGLLGLTCDAGEFCDYEPEDQCGAADQLGTCTPIPDACIEIYAPVCGCDGNTYSNDCFAAAAGTGVASEGECQQDEQFCGGIAGIPCPDGFKCVNDPNDNCDPKLGGADCGGICVPDANECGPVECELYCPEGFVTDDNGCQICECVEPDPEPDPDKCVVGGCSGELCVGPDDPAFSICIWAPWYVCFEYSECGSYGPDSSCGWKSTPEFEACLSQYF